VNWKGELLFSPFATSVPRKLAIAGCVNSLILVGASFAMWFGEEKTTPRWAESNQVRDKRMVNRQEEKALDTKSIDHFRKLLEAAQARMRGDVTALTEEALSPVGGQASGELSNAPFHLGDSGTEEFSQHMNATLAVNGVYLASEVEAALERVAHGTFGTCENCNRVIPRARLEIMPYARYCVDCAEQLGTTPQLNVDAGSPNGPPDTIAPEGEMGEEDRFERTPSGHRIPGSRATGDSHAAGEAGGGTAIGGLAGSNMGDGDPRVAELQHATGSGDTDAAEHRVGRRRPTAIEPLGPDDSYLAATDESDGQTDE
jgi:DnaK suppressor protein